MLSPLTPAPDFMGECSTAPLAHFNLDLSLRVISENAYKASIRMPEMLGALHRIRLIHWAA